MITITKQDNGVLFGFEDSKKYLYGNGSILVPFNTLSIIADESNMITLRKAASNDIFLSARYDTDLGYGSKDDAIDDLKDLLFAETGGGSGSGMTPSEVQEMIDESISGMSEDVQSLELTKADTSAVTAAIDAAISGKADTSAVTAVNDALTAHTANTSVHVTSAEKTEWNAKQDALYIYTEDNNLGTAELHSNDSSIIFNAGGASITANNAMGVNTFNVASTGVTINGENVATEPYVDAALSGKADTSAVTAVQQSLSGKQDTLVSGTNIKTINNESILGSGNITISGGGGQSLVYYTEDTSNESATIMVQNDDDLNRSENRVFVGGDIIIESYNETDDGEGNTETTDTQVVTNSLGLSIVAYSDDGIDTTQTELKVQPMGAYINSEPIATEPYVNAAITGKVDTSAITTAVTSGSTDSEIPTAKAVYDAIPTGGGATYSAGTNISIDTANTINCTLPIYNGTGDASIKMGYNVGIIQCTASGQGAIAHGQGTIASGGFSHSEGNGTTASGSHSHAEGGKCSATKEYSHAEGYNVYALNDYEHSQGLYNVSNTGSTDADKTLFSVGNGNYQGIHNAFEIRQNGDLYFADTDNTTYPNRHENPMVRLQDMYGALGGLKLVSLTQSEYDNLATKSNDTLYIINNVVS